MLPKTKKEIWVSDLTHTQQGNSSWTFPLGASFVYSYAKHISNSLRLYSNSAIGFAKMLQQSNLNNFFRTFSKTI